VGNKSVTLESFKDKVQLLTSEELKHKKQIYEIEEKIEQNNLTLATSSDNTDMVIK
jgi:hypothetical protein